ncbi:S-layer homology domain-containing protein [Halobacillus litoralis]|uniref:S-layer homology domain-containing protein n=1 Tax=Halobacillus litoralis TaxID=45668 RepID=UPI001CD6DEF5|nr:S-layer homology domain-containing protein [Halobacillus litoralis]MCA0972245.1 S-layer homology domain-containing protein [Halobacillus litoralis]
MYQAKIWRRLIIVAMLVGTLSLSIGEENVHANITLEDKRYALNDLRVTEPSSFSDIADDYWASDAVQWGAQNGLIQGYENGLFKPHLKLTEGQFAAILSRFFKDLDKVQVDERIYPYNLGHWSDGSYVNLAKIEAPLMGYDNEFYRVKPVQRGVFAQTIAYVFGQNYELEDSIQYLFEKEITQGVKESGSILERYGHKQSLTRVQAVVFLYRMYNNGMNRLGEEALDKTETQRSLIEKAKQGQEKVDGRSVEDRPDTSEDETKQRPVYEEPKEKVKEESSEIVNEALEKTKEHFEGYVVEPSGKDGAEVKVDGKSVVVINKKENREEGRTFGMMFSPSSEGSVKEDIYKFISKELGVSVKEVEYNVKSSSARGNGGSVEVEGVEYIFTGMAYMIKY